MVSTHTRSKAYIDSIEVWGERFVLTPSDLVDIGSTDVGTPR